MGYDYDAWLDTQCSNHYAEEEIGNAAYAEALDSFDVDKVIGKNASKKKRASFVSEKLCDLFDAMTKNEEEELLNEALSCEGVLGRVLERCAEDMIEDVINKWKDEERMMEDD